MNNTEQLIILKMIDRNIIPKDIKFQINEIHIESYIEIYNEIFGNGNGLKHSGSEYRYAKKLAGMTLIKEQLKRGMKYTDNNAGIVYLIKNSAWPDHYKVGITINMFDRLKQYQTYDPYKRYKISHYHFVLDRRFIEKKILNSFNIVVENGEWIKKDNAITTFFKNLV